MRYCLEIFSICSSHVCANFSWKFWQLLNQPASHCPFRPKLWMPLATIFVEIFEKEKKWWGSGPIGVTSWKDFEISSKKWRFEFFCRAKASTFKMSMIYDIYSYFIPLIFILSNVFDTLVFMQHFQTLFPLCTTWVILI